LRLKLFGVEGRKLANLFWGIPFHRESDSVVASAEGNDATGKPQVVEYALHPAVLSTRDAIEPNAPQLYDDCPNNEAYFYEAGDKGRGKFNVAGHFAAADRRGAERARDQCAAPRAVARDLGSQRDGVCLD
jgi:hypothetical protein